MFLWRKSSGSWRLRATGGGEPTRYVGSLNSNIALTAVTPVDLKSDDVVDNSDPSAVNFRLRMTNGWQDGFDFGIAGGANVCVDVDLPAGAAVLIGAGRTPVTPPFNLRNLAPCR